MLDQLHLQGKEKGCTYVRRIRDILINVRRPSSFSPSFDTKPRRRRRPFLPSSIDLELDGAILLTPPSPSSFLLRVAYEWWCDKRGKRPFIFSPPSSLLILAEGEIPFLLLLLFLVFVPSSWTGSKCGRRTKRRKGGRGRAVFFFLFFFLVLLLSVSDAFMQMEEREERGPSRNDEEVCGKTGEEKGEGRHL